MSLRASVVAAVDGVRRELERVKADEGVGQPIVSRKLKTLMHAAGYKVVTSHLRHDLATSMEMAGLHASPDLSDPKVKQGTYIKIGLQPISPQAFLFAKETHLARFIEASLGRGSLSRLSLYRHTDGRSGREFRVAGRYVDLLCKEALSASTWGLVAIEIKRSEARKGTLTQLCEYLELLANRFPDRQVRGMVISSSEKAIDKRILGEVALRYPIEWFRYKVAIEKVASSQQSK